MSGAYYVGSLPVGPTCVGFFSFLLSFGGVGALLPALLIYFSHSLFTSSGSRLLEVQLARVPSLDLMAVRPTWLSPLLVGIDIDGAAIEYLHATDGLACASVQDVSRSSPKSSNKMILKRSPKYCQDSS